MLWCAVLCRSPHLCVCVCLQYPLLASHYQRVSRLPGVKEYLASPLRLDKVNGNGLG
jgi:hypothetical protein